MDAKTSQLSQDRFVRLWESSSSRFHTEHCQNVFVELQDLYTGADRFYHSDHHIKHCLHRLDQAKGAGHYHQNVEIAIWFHDAIYSAGDANNERNSADWFNRRAKGHLPDQTMHEVYDLIISTEHKTPPRDPA